MKSPLAGNFLNTQIRNMFTTLNPPAPLTPHYLVKSKHPVDANTPANATYMSFPTPPHPTFRRLEEDRVLTSFKESVVQAWPGPGRLDQNAEAIKFAPPRPFEMPDGWNTVFGAERYKVVEGLFDAKSAYPLPTPSPDQPPQQQHFPTGDNALPRGEDTLPSLLHRALQACDADTRSALLSNIVLTGAGSLIEKLPERLQADMQTMYPNPRVRVIAASGSGERKFGGWVGGSVLGSLGTFHQMWVSRGEYAEFGAGVVGRRCK